MIPSREDQSPPSASKEEAGASAVNGRAGRHCWGPPKGCLGDDFNIVGGVETDPAVFTAFAPALFILVLQLLKLVPWDETEELHHSSIHTTNAHINYCRLPFTQSKLIQFPGSYVKFCRYYGKLV